MQGIAPAAEEGRDSASESAAVIVFINQQRGAAQHDVASGVAVDGQQCIEVSRRVVRNATSARGEGYSATAGQTEVIQRIRSHRSADIVWLACGGSEHRSSLADMMYRRQKCG